MLTIQDVADELKIAYNTVWKAIHSGKIKAVKMLSSYRITEEELQRLRKEGF